MFWELCSLTLRATWLSRAFGIRQQGKEVLPAQDESSALEQHTQAQSIHGFTIHDVHPAVPQL